MRMSSLLKYQAMKRMARFPRYLHDKLMTGGTVSVSAPSGRFTFDSKGETAVLPHRSAESELRRSCRSCATLLTVAGKARLTPVFSVRSRDDSDLCRGAGFSGVASYEPACPQDDHSAMFLATGTGPARDVSRWICRANWPLTLPPGGRSFAGWMKWLPPRTQGTYRFGRCSNRGITLESFTAAVARPRRIGSVTVCQRQAIESPASHSQRRTKP